MRLPSGKSVWLPAVLAAAALSAEAAADSTRRAPQIPDESCLPGAGPAATDPPAEAPPLLVEGLGFAGLEPDTENPQARAWFAQGVRLIWAFDEIEAIRAFREAQRLDPDCAMCFFGEAWARSPTINLQPRTEELAAARAAARRAAALSETSSERDRLLIRALVLRTGDGGRFNQAAYARFLESAALRMPQDDTIAIMAADARMQLSTDRDPGSLSQRLLERVLARNPGHGGAVHFYIHLTDWIDRQHLAVPHAERLGAIAPAASHLVHMPSHTFYGVGRYGDAAAVNLAAIAADRLYAQNVRPPRSEYRWFLLAHDMHFAMNSALARGDGETALAVAGQFRTEFLTGEVDRTLRMLSSSLYYAAGLHGDAAEMLARPAPENAIDRLFHHYGRGEALARNGDAAAVRTEARALAQLRRGSEAAAFGRNGEALAEVFQYVLEGRAAMLAGEPETAATAYRKAMNRQLAAEFGNDPPLFWYSVRRSLAAARLEAGDAQGARRQLEASLRTWPNDPLALYALSLADRRLGDVQSADRNLARARAVWAGDVTSVPLARI
jgi:tetratricopeptide (TPR) repeat protein